MTVCIAAEYADGVIAVCDKMVSTTEFSADKMALKFRDLAPGWHAMFAGNDVTRILPLINRAKQVLRGTDFPELADVEQAVRNSFQEELVQKQTDLVLARYGLNMKQFLNTGRQQFGENVFQAIKYQLDSTQLGCVLLVYGIDEDDDVHIFTVDEPGVVGNHDLYGFWSIGSGANRALSNLFSREYRDSFPEWEALYLIAESKFMAEGNGVGEETLVMVQREDGSVMGTLDMKELKKFWTRYGKPKIPRNTKKMIEKSIVKDFFEVRARSKPSIVEK